MSNEGHGYGIKLPDILVAGARLDLADPTNGQVATMTVVNENGSTPVIYLARLTWGMYPFSQAANALVVGEAFKLIDGKIMMIQAVMANMPAKAWQ